MWFPMMGVMVRTLSPDCGTSLYDARFCCAVLRSDADAYALYSGRHHLATRPSPLSVTSSTAASVRSRPGPRSKGSAGVEQQLAEVQVRIRQNGNKLRDKISQTARTPSPAPSKASAGSRLRMPCGFHGVSIASGELSAEEVGLWTRLFVEPVQPQHTAQRSCWEGDVWLYTVVCVERDFHQTTLRSRGGAGTRWFREWTSPQLTRMDRFVRRAKKVPSFAGVCSTCLSEWSGERVQRVQGAHKCELDGRR